MSTSSPEQAASQFTASLLPQSPSSESESSISNEEASFLAIESEKQDVERCDYQQTEQIEVKKDEDSKLRFLAWVIVNTLATIGIVFTNKAIFTDPTLRLNQSTFAFFHFTLTALTLHLLSHPSMGALFTPSRASFISMIPLSLAMCLNVVLPNLSLAFSSVAFYQIVRVLLTPVTALINRVFYGTRIPRRAVYCLIPICCGVAMVSYYDTRPVPGTRRGSTKVKTTSAAGVFFGLAGVLASSLYTVWIGTSHKKFNMNSMQLLFNQAPVSAFLLLYFIPFTDQPTNWPSVPQSKWELILLSGVFACLINISQFFIVAGAGAVSSTVVGHMKTCSIVTLGWISNGGKANDKGVLGILLAIAGIVAYTNVMYQHKLQQQKTQHVGLA